MTTLPCLFCDEPEILVIHEIYADGTFQLETCCAGLHEALCELSPEEWKALLVGLGIEKLAGHRLRRVLADPDGLFADYRPTVRPVTFRDAKAFVTHHHRHAVAPAGWRFGASIYNGHTLLGVVMVGRPVARLLDASTTLEVNRLCLRMDLPDGLRWNACSQLYGWAAREGKRRGFEKIVTYTLAGESGTSLIAAGWDRELVTKGGSWCRPSRQRATKAPICAKVRWGKSLLEKEKASSRAPGGERGYARAI